MVWTRDRELTEILDGNVAAFERYRIPGTSVPLVGAQQMIVDTIERMERVSLGHTAVADAILTALRMPLDERRARHERLMAGLRGQDVHWWAREFLSSLSG